jgi:hypothetical protein
MKGIHVGRLKAYPAIMTLLSMGPLSMFCIGEDTGTSGDSLYEWPCLSGYAAVPQRWIFSGGRQHETQTSIPFDPTSMCPSTCLS